MKLNSGFTHFRFYFIGQLIPSEALNFSCFQVVIKTLEKLGKLSALCVIFRQFFKIPHSCRAENRFDFIIQLIQLVQVILQLVRK